MPGTMFQAVVSPRTESSSKWYTVPLSCVVHTTVLAVIIAVPVIATDMTLPTARSPPRACSARTRCSNRPRSRP